MVVLKALPIGHNMTVQTLQSAAVICIWPHTSVLSTSPFTSMLPHTHFNPPTPPHPCPWWQWFQSRERHSPLSTTVHLWASLTATSLPTSLSTEYTTTSPLDSAVASTALPLTEHGSLHWMDKKELHVRLRENLWVCWVGHRQDRWQPCDMEWVGNSWAGWWVWSCSKRLRPANAK